MCIFYILYTQKVVVVVFKCRIGFLKDNHIMENCFKEQKDSFINM